MPIPYSVNPLNRLAGMKLKSAGVRAALYRTATVRERPRTPALRMRLAVLVRAVGGAAALALAGILALAPIVAGLAAALAFAGILARAGVLLHLLLLVG